MDLSYYASKYITKLNSITPEDFIDLRNDLELDFILTYGNSLTYSNFRASIYKILNILSYLKQISNNNFDADKMWRLIFTTKISIIGLTKYTDKCIDNFMRLADNFSTNKTAIPTNDINIDIKASLDFMGLQDKFTKEQLTRCYRKLAIKYHPDKGGNGDKFIALQKHNEKLKLYMETR